MKKVSVVFMLIFSCRLIYFLNPMTPSVTNTSTKPFIGLAVFFKKEMNGLALKI